MHLTQPAVSMQMKQLEDQIGLALIDQIGKKLVLTEAGQELRGRAARIAAQMVDLNAAMDQFRDLQRGLLRLAVVSSANYFLPNIIAAYSSRYPGVRISLRVANRAAVLSALADNETDLAVTGRPPDGVDLIAQNFMDNPLVVIAAPNHPLCAEGVIDVKRLNGETLVVREAGSGTRAAMDRVFAERRIEYRAGCEFNTNEAIKQAVQAGLGLGVAPLQTVELEQETGRLVVLPVAGFPIIRHWFVVHRADKRLSAASSAFRSLLLSQNPEAAQLRQGAGQGAGAPSGAERAAPRRAAREPRAGSRVQTASA
jgi:DNA-binding transcriptional LysR family regulator